MAFILGAAIIHSVCAAIDFVDCWLHLSITRASSVLHSVRAAILHSSFFILHLKVKYDIGSYLQRVALLGKRALGAVDAAVDKHRVVLGVGEVPAPYVQLDST